MGTYLCNYWSQKNGSPVKLCRILPQNQPEYFGNDLCRQFSLKKVEEKIYMDETNNYFSMFKALRTGKIFHHLSEGHVKKIVISSPGTSLVMGYHGDWIQTDNLVIVRGRN